MADPKEKEKTYTEDEIKARIAEHGLAEWYLEDGWLHRKYNTDGWPTTLMLTNAIGYLSRPPGTMPTWPSRGARSG